MTNELERLLKKTEFKQDAADIAHQFEKAGLTIDTFSDAPRFFGLTLWGHSTYAVIDAIHTAKNDPTRSIQLPPDEPSKLTTKKLVPDIPAESEVS